jgi:hypothetical protein
MARKFKRAKTYKKNTKYGYLQTVSNNKIELLVPVYTYNNSYSFSSTQAVTNVDFFDAISYPQQGVDSTEYSRLRSSYGLMKWTAFSVRFVRSLDSSTTVNLTPLGLTISPLNNQVLTPAQAYQSDCSYRFQPLSTNDQPKSSYMKFPYLVGAGFVPTLGCWLSTNCDMTQCIFQASLGFVQNPTGTNGTLVGSFACVFYVKFARPYVGR